MSSVAVRCTATSKGTGQQCKRTAVPGSTKCRYHGGLSPKAGPTHPTFKHGRYSKDLPTRLQVRYEEALTDTELLSLRDDIASTEARIAELFGRIDKGESGRIWTHLTQAKADLLNASDEAARRVALNEVLRLIDRGNADWMIFEDIVRLQDHKRKLGESERKRQIEMRQILTAEQAAILVGALTDIITRNVTDKRVLSHIHGELTALLHRPDSGGA